MSFRGSLPSLGGSRDRAPPWFRAVAVWDADASCPFRVVADPFEVFDDLVLDAIGVNAVRFVNRQALEVVCAAFVVEMPRVRYDPAPEKER